MQPEQLEQSVVPKQFTVDEYHRLIDCGALDEDSHMELIEGVIAEMTPQERPHARFLSRLNSRLTRQLSPEFNVRVQLPLTMPPSSEPEPDLAVVRVFDEDAAERHPSTAMLVVEVGESSLRKDRGVKLQLYARAEVSEYWIADVANQTLEVYTGPDPARGRYRVMRTLSRDEVVTASSLPGVSLKLSDLWG